MTTKPFTNIRAKDKYDFAEKPTAPRKKQYSISFLTSVDGKVARRRFKSPSLPVPLNTVWVAYNPWLDKANQLVPCPATGYRKRR